MATIDIRNMYREMRNTMECNFNGTAIQRYNKAKKLFLEDVKECLEANKQELIKEVKERM